MFDFGLPFTFWAPLFQTSLKPHWDSHPVSLVLPQLVGMRGEVGQTCLGLVPQTKLWTRSTPPHTHTHYPIFILFPEVSEMFKNHSGMQSPWVRIGLSVWAGIGAGLVFMAAVAPKTDLRIQTQNQAANIASSLGQVHPLLFSSLTRGFFCRRSQ